MDNLCDGHIKKGRRRLVNHPALQAEAE